MSRERVDSSAAMIERTTPAGSAAPSLVTLDTSLRRSRTRSHWIGESSPTPLMKDATSPWFAPYAAGGVGAAVGATRLRGGRVIVVIAWPTADMTRWAAGGSGVCSLR